MDIGTGIAIAGVWIFAGLVGASNTTTSLGLYIGIVVAVLTTIYLS